MLLLKYVPSIALCHLHPIHSSYKEANLTASSKCRKQLSLLNAEDLLPCSPKSLSCSDHGMTEGLFKTMKRVNRDCVCTVQGKSAVQTAEQGQQIM